MYRFNILLETDNPDIEARIRYMLTLPSEPLDKDKHAIRHYTRVSVTDANHGDRRVFFSVLDPSGHGPVPE